MLEIVTTIGATFLAMSAITVGLPAPFTLGRVGPRERAYIIRQAAYWSVFALALGGWVLLGLYASCRFLSSGGEHTGAVRQFFGWGICRRCFSPSGQATANRLSYVCRMRSNQKQRCVGG